MYCSCRGCPYGDDFTFEGTWCDKIGGKCSWYGYCEDALVREHDPPVLNNIKQSTKRSRDETHKRKLERLYKISCKSKSYKMQNIVSLHNGRIIRIDYRPKAKRFFKKYSNNKVRLYNGGIQNGNGYRRVFDYWWEID